MFHLVRFSYLLIILIIGGALITSDWFYYSSLGGFYAYLLSSAFLVSVTGCLLIFSKKIGLRMPSKTPFILFLFYTLYIIGNVYSKQGFNYTSVYALTNLLLLFSATTLFSSDSFKLNKVFIWILILAFLESLVCITQYEHWVMSNNNFFLVTGTSENPNVTAMFLAMSLPGGISFCFGNKGMKRKIFLIVIAIVVIAMLLLHCRTAIIGALIATGIFLQLKYNLLTYFKDHRFKALALLVTFVIIALAIPLTISLYNAKKASADGRKLIWKVSLLMLDDKPMTGVGYGSFKQRYNLAQANYIKEGNANPDEIQNAGMVNMAYNEFLQNGVEGGIPGLLLFAAVVISFLSVPLKIFKVNADQNEKMRTLSPSDPVTGYPLDPLIAAYSGIICFVIMSIMNFTVQAEPVMCLFIIYAAMLISSPLVVSSNSYSLLSAFNHRKVYLKYSCGVLLLLAGIYTSIAQFKIAFADMQNRKAYTLTLNHHADAALKILPSLAPTLSHYESFWKNYGYTLVAARKYTEALPILTKAKTLTTESRLFMETGLCYQKLGQYQQAINEYQEAAYLEPMHFAPRAALTEVYLKSGDTTAAVTIAQSIIAMNPKIPSAQVSRYKYLAISLLKRLNIPLIPKYGFNSQQNFNN
ncbi:MAG: O-antigen ligase family protein [Mucilaginibacter sp.]|uniref:O-antigen ligase family protein n=1 Tax=Mucilaginibacter sp. TaxID=1882438 RepID=UPI0032661221